MAIYLYVNMPQGSKEALPQAIAEVVGKQQLTIFANPAELATSLRTALHTGDVVVVQADQAILKELLTCQEFLDVGRLLLILDEMNEETIAMAHQLRPRFLTGFEDGYSKVGAVLGKMLEASV